MQAPPLGYGNSLAPQPRQIPNIARVGGERKVQNTLRYPLKVWGRPYQTRRFTAVPKTSTIPGVTYTDSYEETGGGKPK